MANYVQWICNSCGYRWDGLSPSDRSKRPVCANCGSWKVHVYKGHTSKNEKKWKEVRKIVLKRDNYTCRQCGIKVHSGNARIHHLSYYDYFNPDNLITLCSECHTECHSKKTKFFSNINFISISHFFNILFNFDNPYKMKLIA
jgi:5-methylcytosine-specific restriction endonuclease McrA